MQPTLRALSLIALFALACEEERVRRAVAPSGSGGPADAAPGSDAGLADLGALAPDAGAILPDAGPPGTAPLVSGLAIRDLAIYQGVRVALVTNAQPVPRRNAPVIAGRPGLLRVFVAPAAGWQPRTVVARLMLGAKPFEASKAVAAPSTEENTDSTFNFFFDAADLDPTTTFSVRLEEAPGVPMVGPAEGARYPESGETSVGARDSGAGLEIMIVPVQYGFDGSDRLPDTTAAQLERFRAGMFALYPTRAVNIRVRQPLAWSREVHAFGNGWSALLQEVLNLRQRDRVPTNVYYYGVVTPSGSFGQFCGRGCVAGLSTLSPNPDNDYVRGSIGLGFSGDGAVGTFVHEVGHAHGRQHAPCEVRDADPAYPYPDASLGVWGYDIATRRLLAPTRYKDMMSYCDPRWISDYSYGALYERITYVNGIAHVVGAARRYRAVLLDGEGGASWGEPVTLRLPPEGEPTRVLLTDRHGRIVGEVEGSLLPLSHLPGGILMIPEPEVDAHAIELPGLRLPL